MPTLNEVVSVAISISNPRVTKAGFGVPLVLSGEVTWPQRVRSYASLDEAVADGITAAAMPATYRTIAALVASTPHPGTIRVGRCAAPTVTYTITVAAQGTGFVWGLTVDGVACEYTEEAGDVAADIATAWAAEIDAEDGVTASATSATITVTCASDVLVKLEELPRRACTAVVATAADPGIIAALDAIQAENSDWWALVPAGGGFQSEACIAKIFEWVQARQKFAFVSCPDSGIGVGATTTDIASDLQDASYTHGMLFWRPRDLGGVAHATAAGEGLPWNPGSQTWAFKTLAGVTADDLRSAEDVAARAKGANTYTGLSGRAITFPGQVPSGEWVDVIRGIAWLEAEMQASVLSLILAVRKVPFTSAGLTALQASVDAPLSLAETPAYGLLASHEVIVPDVSTYTATQKAARAVPDVSFTGTLAGAIHTVAITGRVTP